MGSLLQWLSRMQVLSPVLRPLLRVIVGVIAVPLFRMCFKRVARPDAFNEELIKDLEQWTRGALLLLVATENMEMLLFPGVSDSPKGNAILMGMRILLAIGVIEAMPDQALFAIIHPGPSRLLFPSGQRWQALRQQFWPFMKGVLCRHLDRSSSVFAILAVVETGIVGWVAYFVAIVQFLIIGLVASRDKALDVLQKFDAQVALQRRELANREADPRVHAFLDAPEEPHGREPHGREPHGREPGISGPPAPGANEQRPNAPSPLGPRVSEL